MHLLLALLLAFAAPPKALSPEAGEHNTAAMRFYDAGQLAPAFDEFYAAYQSMPDARRDRAGRRRHRVTGTGVRPATRCGRGRRR